KRNGEAAAKERRERMLLISSRWAADLAGQGAGAKVARWADLEGNVSRGDEVHRALIAHYADAVADALGAQEFNGFTDDFRSADFSRVNQAVHSLAGHEVIDGTQVGRRKAQFIAANSVGDNVRRMQLGGDPRDFHCRCGAPLAHGVENI